MSVAALSTAGFTQYISASSNLSGSQQALQTLGQSLGAGNLSGALTAFNTYQQINQNLTSASSSSSSSSSTTTTQLATDTKALGSALTSGNLASAQASFASMQNDLAATPSQAMANATAAANQTVQWIDDMLNLSSTDSTDSTTTTDPATSMLDSAYGLNSSSTSTDPTTDILDSALDSYPAASSSTSSTSSTESSSTSSTPTASTSPSYATYGNLGSGASVNAYA
jgi:hypothetical protein